LEFAVTLIDVILAAVIGGMALAATFLLPSKTQIQNNQTQKYKSFKAFIYIAGIAALGFGVLLLLLYLINEDFQKIINILKFAALMVIGLGLIFSNIQKSKFMAQCESAVYPQTMVAPGTMVAASVLPQTQVGVATPAQQIGVKPTQTVSAQVVAPTQVTPQQAPAQQIGIKAQPQAQQVAQQPQPVAAQPRVIVIKCPRCKGDMQIDTRMLGQKMKCPHCGIEGRIG
jgi:predicted RNA-binding Zn-ribbon protein involved in translation (DUF1610 family)